MAEKYAFNNVNRINKIRYIIGLDFIVQQTKLLKITVFLMVNYVQTKHRCINEAAWLICGMKPRKQESLFWNVNELCNKVTLSRTVSLILTNYILLPDPMAKFMGYSAI